MGAGADEHDAAITAHGIIHAINQEKIAADMAFAIACPLALEWVILPLRPERRVICDQEHHHFLEAMHPVSAGPRQPLHIFEDALRVIYPPTERRRLSAPCFFRV